MQRLPDVEVSLGSLGLQELPSQMGGPTEPMQAASLGQSTQSASSGERDLLEARRIYTEAGGEGSQMSAAQMVADLIQRGTAAAMEAYQAKTDLQEANRLWKEFDPSLPEAGLGAAELLKAAAARIERAETIAAKAWSKAAANMKRGSETSQLNRGMIAWMRAHVASRSEMFVKVAGEGEELLEQSASTVNHLINKAEGLGSQLAMREDALNNANESVQRLQQEVERLNKDQETITQQTTRMRERIRKLEEERGNKIGGTFGRRPILK